MGLRLAELVPGGCHTYSKGADRFAANAPRQIVRAAGGICWSADGAPWIDWTAGINNVLIGHAEPAIDDAAVAALRNGQSFGRPSRLEEVAAEAVLGLYPQAEQIKFCKNGSDANNAAIRLARAVTGRQHIAFDSAAPFHSTADWFCHQTVKYGGTLDAERAFALPFTHGDAESLARCFETRPLACVILEPCRFDAPAPAFLDALRDLCARHGTLLVLDEVVTGYRYGLAGAAPLVGLEPDLFTLGKGMSNGYSVAALLGKRAYMDRGRIGGDVFLLSTTNGAEQSGLAATVATAQVYQREPVIGRLAEVGRRLAQAVQRARLATGAPISCVTAYDCRPALRMPPWAQEPFYATLADHGVLMSKAWACPCVRRTESELAQTEAAIMAAAHAVVRAKGRAA